MTLRGLTKHFAIEPSAGPMQCASADVAIAPRRAIVVGVLILGCIVPGDAASAAPPVLFGSPTAFQCGGAPYTAAIRDLDGDAKPDVVVANYNTPGTISVLRNITSASGVAAFAAKQDYDTGNQPLSVAIGDIDGDGRPDLVVSNYASTSVSVLRNLSTGAGDIAFAAKVDLTVGVSPAIVAIGDLDGDNKPDIAVTSDKTAGVVSVLRNLSSGPGNVAFASNMDFTVGNRPFSVSIGDVDGDGKRDLAVVNQFSNSVSVLRNLSSGPTNIAFANRVDFSTGTNPQSVAFGDFDADGKSDLATANYNVSTVTVLRNMSTGVGSVAFGGRMDFPTNTGPTSIAVADMDQDGSPDILTSNIDDLGVVSVLRNRSSAVGELAFASRLDFAAGTSAFFITVGDLDSDGLPDVAVTNNGANSVSVLLHTLFPVAYVRSGLTTGANNGRSWADAYRELRDALADIQDAYYVREIWVAKGTYKPTATGDRTASLNLRDNLAIYGGFAGTETSLAHRNIAANPTILSGDLNGDDVPNIPVLNRTDNSYHIVVLDGATGAAIDGLTISGGTADGASGNDHNGGGLYANAGSLIVHQCVFDNNQAITLDATIGQAGAAFIRAQSAVSFERCRFDSNSAERCGAVYAEATQVGFSRCVFIENTDSILAGALVVELGGTLMLESCDVVRNRSALGIGGAYARGTIEAVNTRWLGNSSPNSAGAVSAEVTGQLNFTGCLMVANVGGTGPGGPGAIDCIGSTLSLVGCSLVANQSSSDVGAIRMYDGPAILTASNTVFWQNARAGVIDEQAQLAVFAGASASLNFCSLEGLTGVFGGTANNGFNPSLVRTPSPGVDGMWGTVDDDYGNLRLSQDSPALDTGSNAAVPSDRVDIDEDGNTTESLPWDLDGSPRVQNNTVDRGCYEGFRCPQCPDDREWFSPQSGFWSDDSKWSFSPPNAQTVARFKYPGAYTAAFTGNGAAKRLEVVADPGQSAPAEVTLDLSGRKLNLGVGADGLALKVQGGALSPSCLTITNASGATGSIGSVEAAVAGAIGRIGGDPGTFGLVDVVGIGAKLTLPLGTLAVGYSGTGSLSVLDGATCAAQFFAVGEAAVDLDNDGTPDPHGSILIDGAGSVLKPKFGLNISAGSVVVQNGGTIDCGSTGTIFILPGSTLSGDGTVIGRLVNFGDFSPAPPSPPSGGAARGSDDERGGSAFNTFTVNGEYEQLGIDPKTGAATGRLDLRYGKTGGTPDSDKLVVNGTAKLAGGLFLSPGPGFTAQSSTFAGLPLVTASSVDPDSSRFDVAFFPGLSPAAPGQPTPYFKLGYGSNLLRGTATVTLGVDTLTPPSFNGPTGFTAPGAPTSAVTGDFNGDNKLDLAVTIPDTSNPTTAPGVVTVLLNGGTSGASWLGFTSQVTVTVGKNPNGLAVGRFRGGAQPLDIAVANTSDNSVMRLTNSGGGLPSFAIGSTLTSVGSRPVSLASGDFNGDGSIDLAVANAGVVGSDSGGARVLPNSIGSSGTFTLGEVLGANQNPVWIAAGNLNGDALIDLVTADYGDNTITTMMSIAPGTNHNPVHYPTSPRPVQITPGGLDNPKDLDNDLAAVCAGSTPGGPGTVDVLRNLAPGTGTFAPAVALPIGDEPRSLAIVDMDGDGDNDIAVVADAASPGATEVKILRNDKNGGEQLAFAPQAALDANNPVFVLSGDVDNNATNDLITVNAATGTLLGSASPGKEPSTGAARQESRGNPPPPISVLRNAAVGTPAPCPGDINGDRTVNTQDLTILLGHFGQTVPSGQQGDLDGSGFVNTTDLIVLLGRFGQSC